MEAGGASVLVTGETGPIGRYVADALADRGDAVVIYGGARSARHASRAEIAPGGLSDLPRLLQVMHELRVRRMVHGLGMPDPRASIDMPIATVVAAVEGTLHLLEAARLAGMSGRIVLLSSRAVYGDDPRPADEAAPLRPATPYAVTKAAEEHLGDVYARLHGLDVVALRLGDVYGPELPLPASLPELMAAAVEGRPFRRAEGAAQGLHLTHGEDLTRAVVAALDVPRPAQRAYNVTGGVVHSLEQIAARVREHFPASVIDLGPGVLPGLDQQAALDIGAADRDLGYRPRWGLARGIDDYVEWLLAQREAA